jgi:hypothetical protein
MRGNKVVRMFLDGTMTWASMEKRLIKVMGFDGPWSEARLRALPFGPDDATAGSESELQVAVQGDPDLVDLPIRIRESGYYQNLARRVAAGDSPSRTLLDLERYLQGGADSVWENSWVRFPLDRLNAFARHALERDLLADKRDPGSGRRRDASEFFFDKDGAEWLRIPISYLLKLALADLAGADIPATVRRLAESFLEHFLNDNTSPETFSFYPAPMDDSFQGGRGIARETSQRFLFSQLLLDHANEHFGLLEHGQRAMIYFAPLPPARQKQLNELVPDAHYRDLFMNPCLSGWDRGEAKKEYMGLCHRMLSRSQLNTIAKLREAGILNNNLVVLPNTSNTCLANNGTHISLGSAQLGALMGGEDFGAAEEKYLGDLTIKIVEHFLPLFVGTYSAAPLRMDFEDFHPEKALGFLPHELDYSHLRMIWRRWKKKARLKVFGRPLTPFGPPLMDRAIAHAFGLRGDFVPDFRLLDYMTTLMSTHSCPALDGEPGNDLRLKRELAALGIFHESMSTYLLYKQRVFGVMGFSGFEGRFYSLFDSLEQDMRPAARLQQLLSALACKLILTGRVGRASIPDNPVVESERRQVFFAAAISLPTFFARRDSGNAFLLELVSRAGRVRGSRRYPGNLRVHVQEYRLALLDYIETEGADLVESFGAGELLRDLRARILDPSLGAGGKLTRRVLERTGARSPLSLRAREFNMAAEDVYRGELRRTYLAEALVYLAEDCRTVKDFGCLPGQFCRTGLAVLLGGRDIMDFVRDVRAELRDMGELKGSRFVLVQLLILVIGMHRDNARIFGRKHDASIRS